MVLSRLSNQLLQSTFRNQFLLKRSALQDGNFPWFRSVATHSVTSTARQNVPASGTSGDQMLCPSYSVFKGKAALSVKPMLPQLTKSNSGGVRVGRCGSIMLTFWPAIAERKYNWEKKQVFALSPTEIGSMINLGPRDNVEFFHDPSMLSSNAGQVRKSLSIKANNDGTGYFFSLNVVNNILNINDRFVVPVTAAEFQVMRTALSFALPHILGWHQYANQSAQSVSGKPLVSPLITESEWHK